MRKSVNCARNIKIKIFSVRSFTNANGATNAGKRVQWYHRSRYKSQIGFVSIFLLYLFQPNFQISNLHRRHSTTSSGPDVPSGLDWVPYKDVCSCWWRTQDNSMSIFTKFGHWLSRMARRHHPQLASIFHKFRSGILFMTNYFLKPNLGYISRADWFNDPTSFTTYFGLEGQHKCGKKKYRKWFKFFKRKLFSQWSNPFYKFVLTTRNWPKIYASGREYDSKFFL